MVDPLVRAKNESAMKRPWDCFTTNISALQAGLEKVWKAQPRNLPIRAALICRISSSDEIFFRTNTKSTGKSIPAWRGHDETWPLGRRSPKAWRKARSWRQRRITFTTPLHALDCLTGEAITRWPTDNAIDRAPANSLYTRSNDEDFAFLQEDTPLHGIAVS